LNTQTPDVLTLTFDVTPPWPAEQMLTSNIFVSSNSCIKKTHWIYLV
jgi:hypothetical protein